MTLHGHQYLTADFASMPAKKWYLGIDRNNKIRLYEHGSSYAKLLRKPTVSGEVLGPVIKVSTTDGKGRLEQQYGTEHGIAVC